jgi:hypothetical protein
MLDFTQTAAGGKSVAVPVTSFSPSTLHPAKPKLVLTAAKTTVRQQTSTSPSPLDCLIFLFPSGVSLEQGYTGAQVQHIAVRLSRHTHWRGLTALWLRVCAVDQTA